MTKPVMVRNLKIGQGIPKICVPIVGTTEEEILAEAAKIAALPADVTEWRADWFEGVFDHLRVLGVLGELRTILGERPVLFTFRTSKEGGAREIEAPVYQALNQTAAESGLIDLLDTEVFSGDQVVREIIESAHRAGVRVIASNHDFKSTPPKEELIARMRHMQKLGADILKIAVMPQSPADVLELLSATEVMTRLYTQCPIITMSMSGTGLISRLAGEVFGSALTFGTAGKASAPGQMEAEGLKKILNVIHENLD